MPSPFRSQRHRSASLRVATWRFRRGCRGTASLDARVEVARPDEEVACPGARADAKIRGAAEDARLAVRDEVEEAAGEVGVAVAVQVAVGDRRALRDGLLVREVVVVT